MGVQEAAEEFVLAQGDDPVGDVQGRVGGGQLGLQPEDVAERVQGGLDDEVLRAADGGAVAGLGEVDEGLADAGEVGGRDLGPEGDGDRPAAQRAGEVAAEAEQTAAGERFDAAFGGGEADAEVPCQSLVRRPGEAGDQGPVDRVDLAQGAARGVRRGRGRRR